ncbi:MAG: hypothetical protein ABI435_06745 [Pseudolysinimonas sp.]
MDALLHWAGFFGGWLLVAGPLLQAAIELRDEEVDRESFSGLSKLPGPPKVSAWWWLLPPVAYVKNQRRSKARQKSMYAAMTVDQRSQFVGFMNKARGWLIVSAGASLIAAKETWELVELYELPVWVFWVAIVVLSLGVVVVTVLQLQGGDDILHVDDPGYRERLRAERQAQFTAQKASRKKS